MTKKQRKRLNGPNHAVKQSMKHGVRINSTYVGRHPEYRELFPGGFSLPPSWKTGWKKISVGVPFINIRKWRF